MLRYLCSAVLFFVRLSISWLPFLAVGLLCFLGPAQAGLNCPDPAVFPSVATPFPTFVFFSHSAVFLNASWCVPSPSANCCFGEAHLGLVPFSLLVSSVSSSLSSTFSCFSYVRIQSNLHWTCWPRQQLASNHGPTFLVLLGNFQFL